MFEKGAERLIFLPRSRKLGQVLESTRTFGRAVCLEHGGVAAFVEQDAGELRVRQLTGHLSPAGKISHEIAEAPARLRRELVAVEEPSRSQQQRLLHRAGVAMDRRDRLVAETPLGLVDDPLEREVVGGLNNQAEVCDRV